MLMPKKVKYRKQHRGRRTGKAWAGSKLACSAKSAASTCELENSNRFVTPVRKYWCRYSLGSMTPPRPKIYMLTLPSRITANPLS